MRTNIDIDDKLMKRAMKATGATTKKAAVELALQQTLAIHAQKSLRQLRGKVTWRGHDDDWHASDAEIQAKRGAERDAADAGARKIA